MYIVHIVHVYGRERKKEREREREKGSKGSSRNETRKREGELEMMKMMFGTVFAVLVLALALMANVADAQTGAVSRGFRPPTCFDCDDFGDTDIFSEPLYDDCDTRLLESLFDESLVFGLSAQFAQVRLQLYTHVLVCMNHVFYNAPYH